MWTKVDGYVGVHGVFFATPGMGCNRLPKALSAQKPAKFVRLLCGTLGAGPSKKGEGGAWSAPVRDTLGAMIPAERSRIYGYLRARLAPA